jgi:hypothetical protein
MAILEAKLAQQLAHLEQEPVYGVFLDLKKAFDAPGKMPPDSGGTWRGAKHSLADPQLLAGRDHGLSCIGELRGTVSCLLRHDPGGPTICQAVQHLD